MISSIDILQDHGEAQPHLVRPKRKDLSVLPKTCILPTLCLTLTAPTWPCWTLQLVYHCRGGYLIYTCLLAVAVDYRYKEIISNYKNVRAILALQRDGTISVLALLQGIPCWAKKIVGKKNCQPNPFFSKIIVGHFLF